jgi:lipoyl(octanoyl) transferase
MRLDSLPVVYRRNLGLIDYQRAWDLQEALFAEILAQKVRNRDLPEAEQTATPNYLLVCEHPHVYTLGKSGKPEHLLLDENGLGAVGARYYRINRGGDITYHGPGQLVVYPLFDLDHFFTDIHRYMRTLEEAVIRTCADFGVETGRIAGLTGVWTDHVAQQNPRKLCAMGVKSSRWVTMHGLALNVSPDLSYFGHIVPCGIADKAVTSLAQERDEVPNLSTVAERLTTHLRDLFGFAWADAPIRVGAESDF